MTGSQEVEQPKLQVEAKPDGKSITPDEAMAIAAKEIPGATPSFLIVPRGKQPYRISSRFPEDRTPGGRTRLVIDPYSGKVLFKMDSRTGPGGYRLVNLNRAIHTGDIFGLASKTVMSLASLIMALQLVTGVVMWWKRRTANRKARRATV